MMGGLYRSGDQGLYRSVSSLYLSKADSNLPVICGEEDHTGQYCLID